ncbi:hypothetical protein BDV23DRAFT_167148 [Aspergillus alliaceus]|uniref:Uncharacterized protein n=1 Tax=Petromyces alliaceus TaxID=209559 RepID=A0A5N7BRK5_PETAA|nr:hypothetical protein BDV23DRAFT_167148 [Aspergillus alliaceus]
MYLICDTDSTKVAAFSVRFALPRRTWCILMDRSLYVDLYHMASDMSMQIPGRMGNTHRQVFRYDLLCCLPMLPKGGTWASQCNKCWKLPVILREDCMSTNT